MRDRISDYLHSYRDGPRPPSAQTVHGGEPSLDAVHQAIQKTGTMIGRHPWMSLAAAAAAGLVLGWWVKRR